MKLLILHGLNNGPEAFTPLREALHTRGFAGEILFYAQEQHPGLKEAQDAFCELMAPALEEDCVAVAYSQGALLLQLWLAKNPDHRIRRQLLLAPALSLRHLASIRNMAKLLPGNFKIRSRLPERLRHRDALRVLDYRILLEAEQRFRLSSQRFLIPTRILVDERDELIAAHALKAAHPRETRLLKRGHLKGQGLGKHHLLFHPDYHSAEGWGQFIDQVAGFLTSTGT